MAISPDAGKSARAGKSKFQIEKALSKNITETGSRFSAEP